MPKVIIEFNLPEENNEFGMAITSNSVFSALYQITEVLRSDKEYNIHKSKAKLCKAIEECIPDHLLDKYYQ